MGKVALLLSLGALASLAVAAKPTKYNYDPCGRLVKVERTWTFNNGVNKEEYNGHSEVSDASELFSVARKS